MASRYTELQKNRTVNHRCLVQPDTEQENKRKSDEVNKRKNAACTATKKESKISCSCCIKKSGRGVKKIVAGSTNEAHFTDKRDYPYDQQRQQDDDLKARLSFALKSAGVTSQMEEFDCLQIEGDSQKQGDISSPTSTLQFPNDRHSQDIKHPDIPFLLQEDYFPSQCILLNPDESTTCDFKVSNNARNLTRPQHNDSEMIRRKPHHSFVICADSQIGMTSRNQEWETELEYCRDAIEKINSLDPKPSFACVCGDLVDMDSSFYRNSDQFSKEECDAIQDRQNADFKRVWSAIDDDIPLICLCGNHDVGNRPNAASIQKFRSAFGDEYLSFWVNGTYNIALNNVLFSDPTDAPDLFEEQNAWLENRLIYANEHGAEQIFVFCHHPWFLYDENEDASDLLGSCPFPKEWGQSGEAFPDNYFGIPKKYREIAMNLFERYNVAACFCGHFHQNLVSRSSFGMEMIITASLSLLFESSGKPTEQSIDPNGRGIRIVDVMDGYISHRFEQI
eukprot:CAMPEP_0194382300 /NCGR_PEP_ID=MMETSP0174-20130528/59506_1 /TAXON_ID=216777 /ORGANISM="Proboscia alata, Strain PI-D3" /LENGTH=505 /DNA_ID=CAMNT_0039167491 /DNA_START=198 /DNA_END=1715 /DNA_ORIENTATION=+